MFVCVADSGQPTQITDIEIDRMKLKAIPCIYSSYVSMYTVKIVKKLFDAFWGPIHPESVVRLTNVNSL